MDDTTPNEQHDLPLRDDLGYHLEVVQEPAELPYHPPMQADMSEMDDGYSGQGLESWRADARYGLRRKASYQENAVLAHGLADALEAALADVVVSDLPTWQTLSKRHLDEIASLQAQILERMQRNLEVHY